MSKECEPIDVVYLVYGRYNTLLRVFARLDDALEYANAQDYVTTPEPVPVWVWGKEKDRK